MAGSDDHPGDWARQHLSVNQMLSDAGWMQAARASGTEIRWTRPGKDPRDGHSAVVHGDEVMVCWSTNVPTEFARAAEKTNDDGSISLSPLAVYAAVAHGGDVPAAMSTIRRRHMPRSSPPLDPVLATIQPDETPSAIPSALNLPPEFWESRPWLTQVRNAAWARLLSPDAVLGALISRIAAMIPPSYVIPPIVGSRGTFDNLSILAGHSSGGKTSANAVAAELFPDVFEASIEWNVVNPSGEGLIDSLFDDVDEMGDDGKIKRVYKQVKSAVHFTSDEARAMIAQSQRQGTTIISIILSAWSGAAVGQSNTKSGGRRRRLAAHSYRISGLLGIQLNLGHELLTDDLITHGFAGRVVFFAAEDPTMPHPDAAPAFPGPLDIPLPVRYGDQTVIEYPQEVSQAVRTARWEAQTGRAVLPPIDGHLNLVRLKLAGIIAILEGRRAVSLADWDLACQVVTTHTAIRQAMLSYRSAAIRERNLSAGEAQGEREMAAESVRERRSIARLADRIAAAVIHEDEVSYSALRKRLTYASNRHLFDEALVQAVERGSVEVVDNSYQGQAGQMLRKTV